MNLKKQVLWGVQWMFISTIMTSIVQILRLSILTRFLEKSDFGIVAIITFILGLTFTFTDLGFSSAIMYKQKLHCKEFCSLFWIQLILFSTLYILLSLCSTWIAYFYNEPSISILMPIALLDLILQGIGRLYDTILQKEMLFKQIAIRNIISSLISILIAFILATLDYGIYSLILSTLSQSAILNAWNFIAGQKHYQIKIYINIRQAIPLMKIGIYQTGTQILDYVASKIDVAIIGKLLGSEDLGIYNLAKELLYKFIILINTIVNKVSLPIFAKNQNDKNKLKNYYIKIIRSLSTINFPILAFIASLNTYIITILYGKDFLEAAPILSIFTLWGVSIAIANPQGGLAIATGNTHLSLNYTIIRILITVPIVYLTASFSTNAIAWGQGVLGFIMIWLGWKVQISKIIPLSFKELLASFRKNLIFGIISTTLMLSITKNLFCNVNYIIQIIIYLFLFISIYFLLYVTIGKHELYEIINLVSSNKSRNK